MLLSTLRFIALDLVYWHSVIAEAYKWHSVIIVSISETVVLREAFLTFRLVAQFSNIL